MEKVALNQRKSGGKRKEKRSRCVETGQRGEKATEGNGNEENYIYWIYHHQYP